MTVQLAFYLMGDSNALAIATRRYLPTLRMVHKKGMKRFMYKREKRTIIHLILFIPTILPLVYLKPTPYASKRTQYPFSLSTTLIIFSPLSPLSKITYSTRNARSTYASPSPLICGVTMQLGASHKGSFFGRGSGSVTSSAAPLRPPPPSPPSRGSLSLYALRAAMRSAWTKICPREILETKAFFLLPRILNSSAPRKWVVSFVKGTLTRRWSMS